MNEEKYSVFKSLGKSQTFLHHVETIDFTDSIKIIYDLKSGRLRLVRKIDYGDEKVVRVMLTENGDVTVYSDNFFFCIKDRVEGLYYVESDTSYGIEYCLQNNIITLEDYQEIDFTFPVYKVEINTKLKLNFNDLPKKITKYFNKSCTEEVYQPCGIMFLDLELEMI